MVRNSQKTATSTKPWWTRSLILSWIWLSSSKAGVMLGTLDTQVVPERSRLKRYRIWQVIACVFVAFSMLSGAELGGALSRSDWLEAQALFILTTGFYCLAVWSFWKMEKRRGW